MSMSRSGLAAAKRRVQQALRNRGIEVTRFRSGARAFEAHVLEGHPPGAILDVGANVGQFAGGLRALGFDGDLWSFEPEPQAFRALNRRARDDLRWQCVQTAVGSTEGTATLHVSANSVSSSLLTMERRHIDADPASCAVRTVEVPVVTLDAWSRTVVLPDELWLKIDTQGYEADILAGASTLLGRVDMLRLELSLVPLYQGQPDYLQLIAELRERGLMLAHVEPGFEDRTNHQLLQIDTCFVSTALARTLGAASGT